MNRRVLTYFTGFAMDRFYRGVMNRKERNCLGFTEEATRFVYKIGRIYTLVSPVLMNIFENGLNTVPIRSE